MRDVRTLFLKDISLYNSQILGRRNGRQLKKRLIDNIDPKKVDPTEVQALSDVIEFFNYLDEDLPMKCLNKPFLYKLVKTYQIACEYRKEDRK